MSNISIFVVLVITLLIIVIVANYLINNLHPQFTNSIRVFAVLLFFQCAITAFLYNTYPKMKQIPGTPGQKGERGKDGPPGKAGKCVMCIPVQKQMEQKKQSQERITPVFFIQEN